MYDNTNPLILPISIDARSEKDYISISYIFNWKYL
jgi:hypothetical protein